jgi:3-methylfumaryl-CoA hydratase
MHRQRIVPTASGGSVPARRCRLGRGACGRQPVRVPHADPRRRRVARTSTIDDVTIKEGRTGQLVFVKVRHEVRCNGSADPRWSSSTTSSTARAQARTTSRRRHSRAAERRWQRQIVPTTCCCSAIRR